jgi:hypothetical protein
MPLYDIDWDKDEYRQVSFFFVWSATVADALNEQIPRVEKRFLAEMACRTRLKTTDEVASFNYGPPTVCVEGRETDQKYPAFDPPEPTLVAPARFTDRLGVNVIDYLEGRHVAAVVLFVGADHKADSDGALAFAVRAAGFMSAGVGVVIVDVLPGPPTWAPHLHSLTGVYPTARRPRGGEAAILAVHPEIRDHAERFVVWHHSVAPELPLPTVPVPVCGAMHLKLDLEATYLDACKRGRFPE